MLCYPPHAQDDLYQLDVLLVLSGVSDSKMMIARRSAAALKEEPV